MVGGAGLMGRVGVVVVEVVAFLVVLLGAVLPGGLGSRWAGRGRGGREE